METGGYNGWEEGFFCCQQGEGCRESTRVGQTREWGAPPLGQERSGQAQRASWGPPLLCLPHCFLLGCHSRGMEYPILHSLKLIMPFHEFSPIFIFFPPIFQVLQILQKQFGGFCFCPCVVYSSFWTNKFIRFFCQYLLEHCKSIFCSCGCLFCQCFYCFLTASLILFWLSNIQQASNQWLNLVELMGDSGTWGIDNLFWCFCCYMLHNCSPTAILLVDIGGIPWVA